MPDLLLAVYLLLVLPAQQCWRSLRKSPPSQKASLNTRYLKTIAEIGLALVALGVVMWWSGRPSAALGLALPMPLAGQWGLVAACVLLVTLAVGGLIFDKRLSAEKRAEYQAKAANAGMLPQTGAEKAMFALFGVAAGIGWELLYRGFLLMVLAPVLGVAGAVILAALAYGIGHGYQSRAQFIGSIVSSFLFTIGFALTGSLWWLMLLHAGLPLLALVQPRKPLAAPAT